MARLHLYLLLLVVMAVGSVFVAHQNQIVRLVASTLIENHLQQPTQTAVLSVSEGTQQQYLDPPPLATTTQLEVVEEQQTVNEGVGKRDNSTYSSKGTRHNNRNRKTIYLHIGPLKTATTSIQSAARDTKVKQAAALDGGSLWALDEVPPLVGKCFKGEKELEKCETLLKKFFDKKAITKAAAAKNNNSTNEHTVVFISHEYIGERGRDSKIWNMYMKVLQNWNRVHIIVGYRRYYEWKISMANQIFKLYCAPNLEYCDPNASAMKVTNLFDTTEFDSAAPLHYFEFFGNDNYNHTSISVVNIHDNYDVLERVYCDIMGNDLPNVCKAIKEYKERPRRQKKGDGIIKNKSEYYGYHWIAIAAVHQAVLGPNRNKENLLDYVKTKAKELGYNETTLPKTCLSKTKLEEILNLTLKHEQSAVPEFFKSPKGETMLRRDFELAVKNEKFCAVNTDVILADERWGWK